jgi:DNA polymerase V
MGFPSPALDYHEDRISLDKTIIDHPNSTFFMEAEGNSMINAFIPPKALLVIDRSLTAHNGDIVVAVVQGEFTVRYLKKNDFKLWLCPANSKLPDLLVTPEMEMSIWGVVISIVINPKHVNDVRAR